MDINMNKVDVIIFGGQSNMQGETDMLSECEVVENAYEYKFLTDSYAPLKNPVGEDIRYDGLAGEQPIHSRDRDPAKWRAEHALGSSCDGHTNMVPSFARAYIKESATPVIAVHAPKGATEVKHWLPGEPCYNMLVAKSVAAVKKTRAEYCVEHIYFVWLQGESDQLASRTKEYYKENLMKVAEGLRADVGIEKFGIIRVGNFTNDHRGVEIITAQDEICRENDFFVMLTEIATELEKQPEMMNPRVNGHFGAKGLEVIGADAGAALGRFRMQSK